MSLPPMNWTQVLLQAPAAIAVIMRPRIRKAFTKAVVECFEYVDALNNDDPTDDYKAGIEFLEAQFDLLESVVFEKEEDMQEIKTFIKYTGIPWVLSFYYPEGAANAQ